MRRGLENLRSNCCLIGKFVISLLLLVKIHYVQSSDNGQKLMVATTGATVQIHCTQAIVNDSTAKNSIRWDFKQHEYARDTTLHAIGLSFCSGCSVSIEESIGNPYTIETDFTINNVQPTDAGIYGCAFSANLEATRREFELEVIEPECKLNISTTSNVTSEQQVLVNESDIVQVKCNVSYWGNWRPEFECQPEAIHDVSFTNSSSSGNLVEYVSAVNATHLLHQKSITCAMNFTQTPLSSMKVDAPNRDLIVWTSPMLNVTSGTITSSATTTNCEPQNTTVVVGSRASFSCCIPGCPANYLRWIWYRVGQFPDILYSKSGGLNGKFDQMMAVTFPDGADVRGGRSMLSIKSTQFNNSGRYQCRCVVGEKTELRDAELAVVGNFEDSCSLTEQSIFENDSFQVRCDLMFAGASNASSINCTRELTRSITVMTFGNTTENDGRFLRYVGSFLAIVGNSVTCHLLIDHHNSQGLQLVSKWSRVPEILYAVRNVSISPASDDILVVSPGDEIRCRARGNPVPHVYWLDSTSRLYHPEERYVVDWCADNATFRSKRTVVCVAQNEVNGQLRRVNKSLAVSLLAEADFVRFCPAENATLKLNPVIPILLFTTVVLAIAVVFLSLAIICIKGKGCCRRQVLKSNENAGQNTVQAEELILQHQNSPSPERNVYDWLDELMDDAVPTQSYEEGYERLNTATRSPPANYEQFKSPFLQSAGENESQESYSGRDSV